MGTAETLDPLHAMMQHCIHVLGMCVRQGDMCPISGACDLVLLASF